MGRIINGFLYFNMGLWASINFHEGRNWLGWLLVILFAIDLLLKDLVRIHKRDQDILVTLKKIAKVYTIIMESSFVTIDEPLKKFLGNVLEQVFVDICVKSGEDQVTTSSYWLKVRTECKEELSNGEY